MQDSDELFSVQLRLGDNIGLYDKLPDRDRRIRPMDDDDNNDPDGTTTINRMYAFYPRRWPFDFGYILNVDGVVARRRDLVTDLGGQLDGSGGRGPIDDCRSPGCIEDRWIRGALRRRSRQWQATAGRRSTVVNNALADDGRVAGDGVGPDGGTEPSEGSLRLARRLVVERRKIDVAAFAAAFADSIRTPHTNFPVEYTDLDRDCV